MIQYKKEQPRYSVYGRKWVKNTSGDHYTDAYGRVIAQIDANSFKETYTVYTVDYENNRELVGVYLSIRDAKRETERLLGTPDGHFIAPCLYCGGHENVFECPVRMFDWRNHFMLGNIRTTGT